MTDYECRKIAKMQSEYFIKALKEDDELLDELYPPRFMGLKEAAVFCCLPENTIYAKIGEIPHQKVGKRLIFSDRALTRWIKRRNAGKEAEKQ